jgi:hypothetical protein
VFGYRLGSSPFIENPVSNETGFFFVLSPALSKGEGDRVEMQTGIAIKNSKSNKKFQ